MLRQNKKMTSSEKRTLNICQIRQYLSHRYPLLLVDRVLTWEAGKAITAIKNVTANEEFFNGHFPDKPVMPGVLVIETMAQTAALLSCLTMDLKPDKNSMLYFVGIDNTRFRRPVVPGDQLEIKAEIARVSRGIWKYKTVGSVAGHVAVEADLMCTIRSASDASKPPVRS